MNIFDNLFKGFSSLSIHSLVLDFGSEMGELSLNFFWIRISQSSDPYKSMCMRKRHSKIEKCVGWFGLMKVLFRSRQSFHLNIIKLTVSCRIPAPKTA